MDISERHWHVRMDTSERNWQVRMNTSERYWQVRMDTSERQTMKSGILYKLTSISKKLLL